MSGGRTICDWAVNCKHCVSKREKEEKTQQTGKKLKTQTLRRDIIESTRKRYHRVAYGRPVLIPGEAFIYMENAGRWPAFETVEKLCFRHPRQSSGGSVKGAKSPLRVQSNRFFKHMKNV